MAGDTRKKFNVPYDIRLERGNEENPVVKHDPVNPAYLSLESTGESTEKAYETFLVPQIDVDADKDGNVSQEELSNFMKKFGRSGTYLGRGNDMVAQTVVVPHFSNKFESYYELAGHLGNNSFVAVDAIDDNIIVHERLTDAPPFKSYTYYGGKGELISVNVETDPVRKVADIGKSSSIDPETGDQVDEIIQTSYQKRNIVYRTYPNVNLAEQEFLQSHPMGGGHGIGGPVTFKNPYYNSNSPYKTTTQSEREKEKNDEYINWLRDQESSRTPVTLETDHEYTRVTRMAFENGLDIDQIYSERDFDSVDQAVSTLSNLDGEVGIELTESELQEFYTKLYQHYEKCNTNTDPTEAINPDIIKESVDTPIDMFRVKRLVRVMDKRKRVWLGDLNEFDPDAPDGYSSKVKIEYERDFDYNSYTGYGMPGEASDKVYRTTYKWMVVEIPINGLMLLSMNPAQADIVIGKDVTETIFQKSKLKATAIGDPKMTSSKNVLFRNISCYSGVWYATKVIHKISFDSGYTMDMEFIERDLEVSTNTIKAKKIPTGIMSQISNYAKDMFKEKHEIEKNWSKFQLLAEKVSSSSDHTQVIMADVNGDLIGGVQVEGSKYWTALDAETNEVSLSVEEMIDDINIINTNGDIIPYNPNYLNK